MESAPANHTCSGLAETLDNRGVSGGDATVEPGATGGGKAFLIDDVFDHQSQALEGACCPRLRSMIDQRAGIEKMLVLFEPGEGLSR
jgi:hypothetical protein